MTDKDRMSRDYIHPDEVQDFNGIQILLRHPTGEEQVLGCMGEAVAWSVNESRVVEPVRTVGKEEPMLFPSNRIDITLTITGRKTSVQAPGVE